jgi:hypothetical protein
VLERPDRAPQDLELLISKQVARFEQDEPGVHLPMPQTYFSSPALAGVSLSVTASLSGSAAFTFASGIVIFFAHVSSVLRVTTSSNASPFFTTTRSGSKPFSVTVALALGRGVATQGSNNEAIAAGTGCAEKTVELHVTAGFEADIFDWARLDCAAMLDALARLGRSIYWIGHSVGAQILPLVPNGGRASALLPPTSAPSGSAISASFRAAFEQSLWHDYLLTELSPRENTA